MKHILAIIIMSQFFCTSVWFAGNAVLSDLGYGLNLTDAFLSHITAAIQFGFIGGTFVFALLSITDRFSPSVVFFFSALMAAVVNLGMLIPGITPDLVLLLRGITGFFLAGIYPVGMKIVSDHYREGLGRSLGYLVGALVLGTAFPHLLRSFILEISWKYVISGTSLLATTGACGVYFFVPDGPYRKPAQQLRLRGLLSSFKDRSLRSSVLGYFGHMWELYTFWALVPVIVASYQLAHPGIQLNTSLWSFLIIASGSVACILAGSSSLRFGAKRVATFALALSGSCCLCAPFVFSSANELLFLAFLFVWAMAVIADSPMFSTLIARQAQEAFRGSTLTIVNCIGFSITIMSLQYITWISTQIPFPYFYATLALGPVLGLIALLTGRNN